MLVCTVCETLNAPKTRFCDNCGASLAGAKLVATEAPLLGMPAAEPKQALDAPGHPVPLSAAHSTPCPECGELNAPDSVYCEGCGRPLRGAFTPSSVGAAASESRLQLPALLDVPDGTNTDWLEGTPGSQFDSSSSLDGAEQQPVTLDDVAGTSVAAGLPVLVPDLEPIAQPMPRYQARPTLPIAPPISISFVVEADGTYFNLSGQDLISIGRTDVEKGIYPDVDLTAHGGELGGVSRRHLQVQARGNGWVVEDLSSMNGSWLNGQRLIFGAAQPLRTGDQLRLGSIVLRCESA